MFVIKTLRKLERKRNFFNLIMNSFKNPRAKILINGEILNNFPEFRNKTRLSTVTTFI